jgi:hypothetical protein
VNLTITEIDSSDSRLHSLSRQNPTSPFLTAEYSKFRSLQAWKIHLIQAHLSDNSPWECTGFVKWGRRSSVLEVPALPAVPPDESFWFELRSWCVQQKIDRLVYAGFATSSSSLPEIGKVEYRNKRNEFVLDLTKQNPFEGMRKGHKWSIKQAQKIGCETQCANTVESAEVHANLVSSSMDRRVKRGENVDTATRVEPFLALLESGVATIIQTRRNGTVLSSNLFLLSPESAYNHTAGTSPEGFECGAATFNIVEAASIFLNDGKTMINLGGARDNEEGLIRFKTGFSKGLQILPSEAASFRLRPVFMTPLTTILKRIWR